MGQIWRQSEVTQFFASVGRVIDQKWSKRPRSEENELMEMLMGPGRKYAWVHMDLKWQRRTTQSFKPRGVSGDDISPYNFS